jgi:BirA family biotin operon repressor/biotin-[acetyl-CoA-carboxylase] ligase
MGGIVVPHILDCIARAGAAGLVLPADEADSQELDLCRSRGFPLQIRDGRVHLSADPDALIPAWIIEETPALSWERLEVDGYLETDSTNKEALHRARQGAAHGTLIYAESQTAGRGRKGRTWISPPAAGLYFSLLIRPSQPPNRWTLLTHVSSLALACALREFSEQGRDSKPLDIELKWPNDVLLSGRKTAGILLETAMVGGCLAAAVVGVGVNVKPCVFPHELRDQVTSVGEAAATEVPRRHLLVRILYHFQIAYNLFERGEHREILEQWKALSRMCRDTPIWVVEADTPRPAVTAGLTESGALIIRNPDGSEEELLAGDVSIRRPE